MSDQSTTITLKLDSTPRDVYQALTDVRQWWSKNIQGGTAAAGDEFEYAMDQVHTCRIAVAEAVPDQRVVWRVLDNRFSFVQDQQEWIDTEIRFDIQPMTDGTTELTFRHVGLVPEFECYDVCHRGWRFHVGHSLRDLITTGSGQPNEITDTAEVLGPRIDAALA